MGVPFPGRSAELACEACKGRFRKGLRGVIPARLNPCFHGQTHCTKRSRCNDSQRSATSEIRPSLDEGCVEGLLLQTIPPTTSRCQPDDALQLLSAGACRQPSGHGMTRSPRNATLGRHGFVCPEEHPGSHARPCGCAATCRARGQARSCCRSARPVCNSHRGKSRPPAELRDLPSRAVRTEDTAYERPSTT